MADNENTRAPAGTIGGPVGVTIHLGRHPETGEVVRVDPPAGGSEPTDDAQHAAWLADKIVALGDYAKEAAEMLRRWPAPAAGEPSGEYMGLPFAEARRRILEMPQGIAQGLAISLLIQNGTLNRALAAAGHQAAPSEPQAGQEVSVSDTRGKA